MKRLIALLMAAVISLTLIACSKQPTTQPNTEYSEIEASESGNATSGNEYDGSDGNDTVNSEEPTENSTLSTTATEETRTAEKEDAESTPTETSPPPKGTEATDPPKANVETVSPKETEASNPAEESKTDTPPPPSTEKPTEPTEVTEPETQPEETTPVMSPSTSEIERLVAQYINQYRAEQGSTTATVLTGLTDVARYRARQLVTDFSHNSNPNPCTVLQYGEYIDMTLFGGDASESYYRGYNREAIGKGDWFGTADQMAQRIANGFKNSSSHWAYVGNSEYSYMAVGVHYNESNGKWYCCVCMSSKNYGD